MWAWLKGQFGAIRQIAEPAAPASGRTTVLYATFEPLPAPVDPAPQIPATPFPANPSAKQSGRRKRMIRFARMFPQMRRIDARLLFAIHRTTVRSLAAESPAVLHRDLKRFSLSSRGQKILRGRPLPPIAKVRAWVVEARCRADQTRAIPASPR